jgi:hypothetical protein
MNRIAKTVKSNTATLLVALLAAYFGANLALNAAPVAQGVQQPGTMLLVDDPVPCPKC